jgi:hypothetical protein
MGLKLNVVGLEVGMKNLGMQCFGTERILRAIERKHSQMEVFLVGSVYSIVRVVEMRCLFFEIAGSNLPRGDGVVVQGGRFAETGHGNVAVQARLVRRKAVHLDGMQLDPVPSVAPAFGRIPETD